jgi:hypothetical protein
MLRALEAWAELGDKKHRVFTRVGEQDDRILIDLGNAAWEVVDVCADGWTTVQDSDVRFQRSPGMMPLPQPESGGTLDALRPFVNVGSDDDWVLLVAWLAAALHPRGPYPALLLQGEQGSAKTTTARVLRALVDPSVAPLRATPKSERDLVISAMNSWVLAFDNLSGLSPRLADALCRLSTGGGFATRRLYSDADELLVDVTRPVVLNGIDNLGLRQDLLDRSVVLELPSIPDSLRQSEQHFWKALDEARPRILGALLTAVSRALRHIHELELPSLPRMADFALWSTAVERGLKWPDGTFADAYHRNRFHAVELALEGRPVGQAIRKLVTHHSNWTGTAACLLETCSRFVSPRIRRSRDWPSTPVAFKNELRRLKPGLQAVGISWEEWRESNYNRDRMIRLRTKDVSTADAVSTSSDLSFPDGGLALWPKSLSDSEDELDGLGQ